MPLESATYISDLNTSNPVGSTDKVQTLDDHVRLIKSTLKTTFPSVTGAVTASHAELNLLDGVTASTAELNILDGVTLTASQINDAALKSAANTFTAAQIINSAPGSSGQLALRGNTTPDPNTFLGLFDSGGNLRGSFGYATADNAIGIVNGISGGALNLVTTGGGALTLNGVNVTDYARLSQSNTFTSAGAGPTTAAINLSAASPFIRWDETDAGANNKVWMLGASGATWVLGMDVDNGGSLIATPILVERSGTTATSIALAANAITLNGVNVTDYARLSQPNIFTAAQTITTAGASNSLSLVNSTNSVTGRLGVGTGSVFLIAETNHPLLFYSNNTLHYEISAAGNHDFKSGAMTTTGAVTFGTIANSTSTTLVAGQLHFITGNASLPNLTAGQWIEVINDSASPITISKNASDTTYWTATGASVSTSFTLAARGRLSAVCSPAGDAVYVGGNITAAS